LCVAISDAALTAAADGTSGEVELRKTDNVVDARLAALVKAVNAERIAGGEGWGTIASRPFGARGVITMKMIKSTRRISMISARPRYPLALVPIMWTVS
jgi:hypothetical protein